MVLAEEGKTSTEWSSKTGEMDAYMVRTCWAHERWKKGKDEEVRDAHRDAIEWIEHF